MGSKSRPRFLNKSIECIKCKKRTFPVTSTMECRECNSHKFFVEYQKEGKK